MTTILSFDVGIINLSYCILTQKNFIKDNGEEYKNWDIIEWNNIDLTNRCNEICHCGKKASLSNIIDGTIKYYCKIHSRHLDLDIEPFENNYIKSNTTNNLCCSWGDKNECIKKGLYLNKINDKHYCSIHAKSQHKNENKNKEIKNIKKSIINFDDIKYKIISELDKRKHFLNVNYIVIENQPAFKNPKMKSVASTLYDYYLIRGIIDKEINKSNIIQVKFQAPSNKLKLINNNDLEELNAIKNDKTKLYKLTKNLSIKYCLEIIQHLPLMVNYFTNYKKKDDLADSFLQGIYFWKRNLKIIEN